jgi:hypothetical protein
LILARDSHGYKKVVMAERHRARMDVASTDFFLIGTRIIYPSFQPLQPRVILQNQNIQVFGAFYSTHKTANNL